NPDFGTVLGVDLGETGIRVEAFDLELREVAGITVDVHPQEREVGGVGVAVPGVVAHDPDARVHAPSVGWSGVPLARLLREHVDLPLFVENGAKTLGQAEMWLGAGRGHRHAVVTLWGTGV